MKGISKKEIEIIANLEFKEKYFFTSKDIDEFAESKTQRYNIIKSLIAKKRIIKLNRCKYYLVPIKARSGKWSENSFILADEICDGKNYFIGGWTAASYWKLTDQIPMQIDIFTTRRQGKIQVMNNRIVFHRTTKKKIEKATIEKIGNHQFKILSKESSEKWMKKKD